MDDYEVFFGEPERVDRAAVVVAVARAFDEMGLEPGGAQAFVDGSYPGDALDLLDVVDIVVALRDMGWQPPVGEG